ncbi:hypothetical protein VTL71DRAFT_9804 [Oculimacula yallundae]|uniref:Zn(2)-C6 fungal-type domain-containing protein n=1 Tax=Oculimacula yallundae TaxID=86028 RepID=A0ABR4BQI4_9HELO
MVETEHASKSGYKRLWKADRPATREMPKRKVKCGQEMPTCFNCRRLGLTCERRQQYRLKDVTLEIRQSICSTTSERGTVWDPSSPRSSVIQSEEGVDYTAAENIAAQELPGSYFINATPDNLFEICKDDEISELTSSLGPVVFDRSAPRKDKNVTTSDISSAAASTVGSLAKHFERQGINLTDKQKQLSMFEIALVQSRDLQYYNHYRNVVVYKCVYRPPYFFHIDVCSMQVNSRIPASLKPFCHDKTETEDTFERAAAVFRPLYHAMLALSALSFAHRERLDRVDALEHYQQAVSGLRKHPGPESVDLIYTHYFLLLYEVAACENGQANIAFTHMSQLVRLIGWFLKTSRMTPNVVFSDVTCSPCTEITVELITSSTLYLDAYNLWFGRQIQPMTPDAILIGLFNAVENGNAHVGSAHGIEKLALILPKLLIRGGWAQFVVRELIRDLNTPSNGGRSDMAKHFLTLDDKINDMHVWCQENSPPVPLDIYDETYLKMPVPSQTTFDSAQFTLRATSIYAHTAMYPSQRLNLSARRAAELDMCAQEILALTRPRWGEILPIAAVNLMAIFVCGTIVSSFEDKEEVLAVLRRLGSGASGKGPTCAIKALKELYLEQQRVETAGGNQNSVDWLVYLKMRGLLDFCPFGI